MTVEIKIPSVGESITEVFIGDWYVSEGDWVEVDQNLVGLETDKATFDVPATSSGVLSKVILAVGETAAIGDVLGEIDETAKPPKKQKAVDAEDAKDTSGKDREGSAPQKPAATAMPSARRALHEAGLDAADVEGSGRAGRVRKEDVSRHVSGAGSRETRAVPLSPIRKTIAHRLVSAQQNAALLTTFNEVDLTVVKSLRVRHQEAFTKKYGIKLGFMSFFVKAVVDSLRHHPAINAQFDEDRLIFHNYYDIGIAVGGGKGLVVPVLRNAENMSFAEIELSIADFGQRAQKNAIGLDELEGGTFTITNGGVYGSLLSTPIVNPPQSGVLGMHGIVDRPVAVNGEVVIRPMMYTALTYDHRVVDGKDAVTFLKRISDVLEDPTRMILEI